MQRQQNKPQPKLDLATAHFPPLPTSSSSENGTAPSSAPPTTSLEAVDSPKTLSDIVRGNTRPIAKESPGNPTPSGSVGGHTAVASSVVEKSLAFAAAKVSGGAVGPTPSDTPPQQPVNSDPMAASSEGGDGGGGDGPGGVAAPPTAPQAPRVMTASSVVASGGPGPSSHHHHPHHQNTGNSSTGSRAPPPPPAPAANKVPKGDSKV